MYILPIIWLFLPQFFCKFFYQYRFIVGHIRENFSSIQGETFSGY